MFDKNRLMHCVPTQESMRTMVVIIGFNSLSSENNTYKASLLICNIESRVPLKKKKQRDFKYYPSILELNAIKLAY